MKKIFIALLFFVAIATQGQTYTITNPLKLGTVNTGSTSDDILVRGTDKIVKKITVSNLLSTIPAQVNADWNATSGTAEILNKPEIPSVSGLATSTYVDDKDSGLQSQINGKQATLVSAINIKTINGISVLGEGDIPVSGGVSQDWQSVLDINSTVIDSEPSIVSSEDANNYLGLSNQGFGVYRTEGSSLSFGGSGYDLVITGVGIDSNIMHWTDRTAVGSAHYRFKPDRLSGDYILATLGDIKIGTTAPSSAISPGTPGEIRVVSGFIYWCVATNTWIRAAGSTF